MLAEMNDRARRSSNVMVYALPESLSADVNARKKNDLDLVSELLKSFYLEFDNKGIKTTHVGKNKMTSLGL